jgi:hypothetical protein
LILTNNRVGINKTSAINYDFEVNGTGYFGGTGKGLYSAGFLQSWGTSNAQFQVQTNSRAAVLAVDTSASSVNTPNLISNSDFENPSPVLNWTAKNGSTLTCQSNSMAGS